MAFGYPRSLVAAALMTLCISSPTYATTAATTSTVLVTDNGFYIGTFVIAYEPAFNFEVPAAAKDYREAVSLRHPPEFVSMAVHQRRSLSAVRPSAVAGWRSGRVRRLASV